MAHTTHHAAHHTAHREPHAAAARSSYMPTSKTMAATVGSAAGGIFVYFVNKFSPGMISPEIAGMVTVVATFAIGYLVPHGPRETIVATPRGRRAAVA
jgi:hypothetical protein